jgi:FkbM family methyltransferase
MFRWIGTHRGSPGLHRISRAADNYGRAYWNRNFNLERNGETRVIRTLVGGLEATVLDVGAHHGDWSAAVRECSPLTRIHAFEILETHREILRQRFSDDDLMQINDVGLASAGRGAEVVPAESVTSLLTRALPGQATESVVLTTGDEYLASNTIERVDLLKVDVEGMELDVLRGFTGAFGAGTIRAVQCEVNLWRIAARATFADFYDLFADLGFEVGWVFPRRVEFLPYDLQLETRDGINLIAVPAGAHATQDALRGS